MASVVTVEVQEVCESYDAFVLDSVGTDVSPLLEHGAVELFNLAIGLRSVRAGT